MGQCNFKKLFEFHSFSEIFYCGMTRHRNTNLDVFIQCQHTRTILRNKNMGQSLFKKYSKSQKFNETLCCGMTRLRNTTLDFFYIMSVRKNYFTKEKYETEQSLFKKHSKFLNFNEMFSCGMTTWPNARKNNNFLEHIFTQNYCLE